MAGCNVATRSVVAPWIIAKLIRHTQKPGLVLRPQHPTSVACSTKSRGKALLVVNCFSHFSLPHRIIQCPHPMPSRAIQDTSSAASWQTICCWSSQRNVGKSNKRCHTNDWPHPRRRGRIWQTTPGSLYIWNYRWEQLQVCTGVDSQRAPWVSWWFEFSHPPCECLYTTTWRMMRHSILLSNTTGQQTSLTKWQPKTRFDFVLYS